MRLDGTEVVKYNQLSGKKRAKKAVYTGSVLLLLTFFAVYFLFPFIYMLSVSLQTESEMMTAVGLKDQLIPDSWRWQNYLDVFRQIPFARYFMNSGIVTGLTVLGTTVSASLVAYSFARLRWPGRDFIYSLMLVTMMIPGSVLMIPTYKMYSSMGLTNSWWPLILPAFLGGGAGNVILIQQFFKTVPKETYEAAKIDGAGELGIWWRIMMPLSKPVIATVAVFAFLFSWNDYMGPMIYINDTALTTVALGLRAFFSQLSTNWSLLMAGSIISMIPNIVIFVFCQRYFLEGIKSGAVKG
ncbi:ABC-type glycerol-3-phosphate transport system permease component [Anaerotaenia torta]|uniref:carbohydrate ABC transporter permease n=1 Tax=Anaerotaenia torta TaxID=433293 RepID=UPI003D25C47B